MRRKLIIFACSATVLSVSTFSATAWDTPESYGFGRPPTSSEVTAWNITIMPDGTGLPPGHGTVAKGAAIYSTKCAACHGRTGSEGPFETLVGTQSLAEEINAHEMPKRTIGNTWFSAPVLFDYVRRAMPFNDPGSLTTDELYSLTGWLLYRNGLFNENQTVDAKTLSKVKMPASRIFVEDPRRPWLVR